MRTTFIYLIICLLMVIASGCGSGGDTTPDPNPNNNPGPSEIDHAALSANITQTVQANFDENDVQGSYEQAATAIRQLNGVSSVAVFSDMMMVTYDDNIDEYWLHTPDRQRPVWVPERDTSVVSRHLSELVEGDRALFVNVLANDPTWDTDLVPIASMRNMLEELGYTVETVSGDSALISTFENLDDYACIFVNSHGNSEGSTNADRTWILTGDRADDSELEAYHADRLADRIGLFNLEIGNNTISYWGVSDLFFESTYSDNEMNAGIFYNACCRGLFQGTNTGLAQTLIDKGVTSYLGWTESQGQSMWTADVLFGDMSDADDIATAYAALAEVDRVDPSDQHDDAELLYWPDTSGSIQLTTNNVPAYSIEITAPESGATFTNRVITVNGTVTDAPNDIAATIFVNGNPSALTLDDSDSFSQDVVIQNGSNEIMVRGISSAGTISSKTTVNGDFEEIALWTELIWDTDTSDVDFHLLPPGADLSYLWTNEDCYYSNMSTSWGAVLDVDDVEGYGPEHITMNAADDGEYTLVVHFYDIDDAPPVTNAQVFVATFDGQVRSFGPRELITSGSRTGDVWTVCTIDFPSGTISEVNDFRTLSGVSDIAPPAK